MNDTPFPECNVKSVQGLAAFVESVMRETWTLEAGVSRSRTLGYLAQVQKGIVEMGELEARVAELERIIGGDATATQGTASNESRQTD